MPEPDPTNPPSAAEGNIPPVILPEQPPAAGPAADGGETQRLQARLAEAQAQAEQARADERLALIRARQALIRAAVETAAARAGFHTPADALALADLSAVTVDDTAASPSGGGQVEGVEEAIKALARARAYLLKPTPSAGIGTPPAAAGKKPGAPANVPPAAPLVRF